LRGVALWMGPRGCAGLQSPGGDSGNEQSVDEALGEPLLVGLGRPLPVLDEELVHLGRVQRPDDVPDVVAVEFGAHIAGTQDRLGGGGGVFLRHDPIRAAEAFTAVHDPVVTDTGQRIAGLRLGDRRAQALLQALLVYQLLPHGFRNRDLRALLCELLGRAHISSGQMSYDLRRLRPHALITRVPGTHRYRLTDTGLHHAMLLTHVHTRILQPALAQLADPDPPAPSQLRTAARNYQQALAALTQEAGLAA
jgi:hypothetical protein